MSSKGVSYVLKSCWVTKDHIKVNIRSSQVKVFGKSVQFWPNLGTLGQVRPHQCMSGQARLRRINSSHVRSNWGKLSYKCQLRSCQLNLVHTVSLHSSSKVMFCQAGHVGSRWVTMGQEGSCRVHLGHAWLNQVTLGQVRLRWDTTGQGKANRRSSC